MSIKDVIFYLKQLNKYVLVNSPQQIALNEAIRILSKVNRNV